MSQFSVPTRDQVSPNNQTIFDNLNKQLGFVPNLYATYAHSDTALENYLQFSGGKTSLNNKEKEVVNLVVSQINGCDYCKAAHTAIGKMNGFTDEQILEIRSGNVSFDSKLNALTQLVVAITKNKGRAGESILSDFFNAGYTNGNLVDVIVAVGDKTISNYLHNLTQVPIDFPLAPELQEVTA